MKLRHVGITTGNLSNSIEFYACLGFDKIKSMMKETGNKLSLVSGLKDVEVRTTKLQNKHGDIVEFLEYSNPKSGSFVWDVPINTIANLHIAITVDDIFETYEELIKHWKSCVVCVPQEFENVFMTFVRDPNGVLVELVQEKDNLCLV